MLIQIGFAASDLAPPDPSRKISRVKYGVISCKDRKIQGKVFRPIIHPREDDDNNFQDAKEKNDKPSEDFNLTSFEEDNCSE